MNIDTTLVNAGGRLRPRATAADIELSAGGNSPFASLKRGKRSFGVSWPTGLPRPQISRNTAKYSIPGGELVVQALKQGISHSVILRDRPRSPVEIRLPLVLDGLRLSKRKSNHLRLADGGGKIVADAAAPRMWDSTIDRSRPDPVHNAEVATEIERVGGGQVLVLRPDPAFLRDPKTRYPVTIDPTSTLTVQTDTWVATDFPDSQVGSTQLRAGSYNSAAEKARSYIKFNGIANLAGKHILDTDLRLWNYESTQPCPTTTTTEIRRVTANWDSSAITWGAQPATTSEDAKAVTGAYGCQDSNGGIWISGWIHWDVDGIVQDWAGGQPNYGIRVAETNETLSSNWRKFFSANSDNNLQEPTLDVTYNSYPAAPASLSSSTVLGTNGRRYATTTTPTLTAGIPDADGGQVRVDVEVSHDPAKPEQGAGVIWSGSKTAQAGTSVSMAVPSNTLQEAWWIRWRVRGYDGTDFGPWSGYQYFTVSIWGPKPPTISCPDYPEGVWSPKASGAVTCTLDTISVDGSGYYWSLDDPTATTLLPDPDGSGGDALTVPINPATGFHTLYAKARDTALNTSTTTAYTFGVGVGEVVRPQAEDRTQEAASLVARAPVTKNQVTFQYALGTDDTASWGNVPPADVSRPGDPTPIAGWPQTRADPNQDFAELVWNLAATMRGLGRGDGPLRVRACFAQDGAAQECSAPHTIILERTAFGASYATEPIGPGRVSLLTGDFALSASDGGVAGLAVSRTHTTLAPVGASTGAEGIFGPGWVASFPAGAAGKAGYTLFDGSAYGYVILSGPDGETLAYAKQANGTYKGLADASDGSVIKQDSATRFSLTDSDGVQTVWTFADGKWGVSKVVDPAGDTQAYTRDGQGRVTRVLAPVPAGVSCGAPLVAGCRALDIEYATATTATGPTGPEWGDFAGRVRRIRYTAYDPATATMKSTAVAQYLYDSTGYLRATWDPRITPGLKTIYGYDEAGRIKTVTPPGVSPFTLAYDSSGRLAHARRVDAQNQEVVQSVVYGVPTAGADAPVNLARSETEKWGQNADLPRIGTAVFPPSHKPVRDNAGDRAYHAVAGDWKFARLTYLDTNGRAVNAAGYGAGAWQISTAGYDQHGNSVMQLSPGNRAQALTPTADTDPYVAARPDSAERASLLANTSTYGDDGELLVAEGPAHRIQLDSGDVFSARQRTVNIYDEGKPDPGTDYHLITTSRSEPEILDAPLAPGVADIRTTKIGYNPIVAGDTSGWTLHQATTETTTMSGQPDITKRTRYDTAGRVIESWMPASNGSDAGVTSSIYYTAAANSGVPGCGGKPQWAGLICRSGPKTQPTGKPLPVTETTYSYLLQPDVVKETSGSTTRTTTTGFDGAGRPSSTRIVVSPAADGGAPIPDATYGYDPQTGAQIQISAGGSTLTSVLDEFGREVGYTDATLNGATTKYDIDGRVKEFSDGKGTAVYTYDGTDAAGLEEHRGLITKVDVTGVGSLGGGYSADGQLTRQSYPNGLTLDIAHDAIGRSTSMVYGTAQGSWLQWTDDATVHGQTSQSDTPMGIQRYRYDTAGRLARTEDGFGQDNCVTRVYTLTANSDRARLDSYAAASGGTCTTDTTPQTQANSYDEADRITNAGYAYDSLGRTTAIPAGQAAGVDMTVGYYSNDMVASQSQGTETATFSLDPADRVQSVTTTGGATPGTITHHYADNSDSPAWTSEADGSWLRYIDGLTGDLAAVQSSQGAVKLQLTNLHGDVVATVDNTPGVVGVDAYVDYTEYGTPRTDGAGNGRYGWLGGNQRSSEALGGVVLMGARL